MNKSDIEFGGTPRALVHRAARDARVPELVIDAAPGLQPAREIEVVRLLKMVWQHKFLVMGITLACAAMGLGIALIQTPTYQSHGTVELLGINENFMNQREVDPNASPQGSTATDAYLATEIELLKSEALVRRVVQKLGLVERAREHRSGVLANVKAFLGVRDSQGGNLTASIVAKAQKNLRIDQVRGSNLLEISYSDSDPGTAAEFINALTQEAITANIDDRWNLHARVGSLLSKQVDVLRARMEKAANELQSYSRESGLLYVGDKNSVAENHLTELETELSQAQNDRIQKESQYRLAKAADPDSLPQVLDNGPLREYQMRLADLNRQYADLLSTRTPENAKVIRIKAQIDALQETMKRERANILNRIENDYNTAKHREGMLASAYRSQTGVVSDQSAKGVRYSTLKRDVDTTRDLYEALLRRVNDAEMVSAIRAGDIRLVDAATPPSSPHTPNTPLLTGIGMFGGLLIGFTAIFVKEHRDKTIQDPGFVSSLLNTAELGVIPSAKPQGPRLISSGRKALSPTYLSMNQSEGSGITGLAPMSYSMLKDSFRGVVNSILFAENETDSLRVILVSSPHAGEGKTTSVCNLGVAFAEIGRRVLLIDADFRKPRLHEIFNVSTESGLLNLLSEPESMSLGELRESIRPTNVPGLSVLTAGSTSIPLPTLLHSDRLSRLLTRLRGEFDLILIDSAPLLLVPESRILARSTDGMVLVIRAGMTTTEIALAARRRVLEDRTPLLGTILNDWKPDTTQYYHYYASHTA